MKNKNMLAALCIAAVAGVGSHAAMASDTLSAGPQLLAVNDAAKAAMKPAITGPAGKATATHQVEGMLRASEFIGEEVRNGKGDAVGKVDDLILQGSDNVLYAVLSVGGFLGIGDRLVAVPFEELKIGVKEVDGLVIYETTKDQLKKQPAFHYAVAKDETSRERFMQSAEQRVDRWQGRIKKNMDDAKSNAKEIKKDASERVESAWEKVQEEWKALKNASAEAWDDTKRKFDDAMADLESAWDEVNS